MLGWKANQCYLRVFYWVNWVWLLFFWTMRIQFTKACVQFYVEWNIYGRYYPLWGLGFVSHSFRINTHRNEWKKRSRERKTRMWPETRKNIPFFSSIVYSPADYHKLPKYNIKYVAFQMCNLNVVDLRLSLSFSLGLFCFVAAGLSQIIICLMWNQWFIIYHHCCDTSAVVCFYLLSSSTT